MDAPEEDYDIKLQKVSSDLIADFDRSLLPYLRKPNSTSGTNVRSRVRIRDTERLISLLDPFQELPQLLDQHLPQWLPPLAEGFLDYLLSRKRSRAARSSRSDLLIPLSTGISKILYTFCKIRGEKVIVRFLNNEAKYLELLSSALEECERNACGPDSLQWSWEERYIVLLWLSHLFLAPFDLATISSVDVDEEDMPSIPGFRWPQRLPGITVRVLPLAIKYLESPGKERDAAKALLVRIAMRRDMLALGVLDALVQWALTAVRPRKDDPTKTPYYYIGILSFLAGILTASSDTSDLTNYLKQIFHAVYETSSEQGNVVSSSALARKMMIKVIRSVTVQILRVQEQDRSTEDTELVETTIGYLLESLADNDTPVRLAASKALSIITLKLEPDMASQVVEAVIDSLSAKILWTNTPTDRPGAPPTRTRDLSAANPLEWHGLMMTLSHLLYRRSPPAENLSDIINALLMGLSFEQRSFSGGAIGTNVRDAACFGIWALARRYTTKELLAVPTGKTISSTARHYPFPPSVLQILGSELIIAGSLDPAGNIRRGSSAALQELIGRHPDTVHNGIAVVQTVDYHAVALRAHAIKEVALGVTKLYTLYGEALVDALLSWRGVGDADVGARRAAAASFGCLTTELARESADPVERWQWAVQLIVGRLGALQAREVEERHGLLLALAAVFDAIPGLLNGTVVQEEAVDGLIDQGHKALEDIMMDCRDKKFRRPELVAEAASTLVVSSFPLLQAAVLGASIEGKNSLISGCGLVTSGAQTIIDAVYALDRAAEEGTERVQKLVSLIHDNLREWWKRSEEENISVASQAGLVMLCFCAPDSREDIIRGWTDMLRTKEASKLSAGGGYFAALSMAYPVTATFQSKSMMISICQDIAGRWRSDTEIETRVAILKSLTVSELLRQHAHDLLPLIEEGLDDYTTNARGDVGSLVRLQAIRATKSLWQMLRDQAEVGGEDLSMEVTELVVTRLFPRILRLASEKLDRVRVEAQSTLTLALLPSASTHLQTLTFSSLPYFTFLLSLLSPNAPIHPLFQPRLHPDPTLPRDLTLPAALLSGYVTSSTTGNEDLVIASRAALVSFCSSSAQNLSLICHALHTNLALHEANDRTAVPTLEIMAFLFHVGVYGQMSGTGYDWRKLCLLVQRAGYKSGNVRKLEAVVGVYGGVASLSVRGEKDREAEEGLRNGVKEARRRLGALLSHPWPRVRSAVVDELWGMVLVAGQEGRVKMAEEVLMGVDWGKADKGAVRGLVEKLGLA